MAQLETGIKDTLLADAGITALVGSRIRPLAVGISELPYVTYKVSDRTTKKYLDAGIDDYRKVEFELGIYSDRYDTAMDLSDLCRERLDAFGSTVSGVEFAPCEFGTETDIEEVVLDGQELPVYLRVQTYEALYRIV